MATNHQKNLNSQAVARKWGIWGTVMFCVIIVLSIVLAVAPYVGVLIVYLAAWIGSIVVNINAAIKYNRIKSPLTILFGFFGLAIIGLIIFLIVYLVGSGQQQNTQNYQTENHNQTDHQNNHDHRDYESKTRNSHDEKPKSDKK